MFCPILCRVCVYVAAGAELSLLFTGLMVFIDLVKFALSVLNTQNKLRGN
jgi:hypothetical protein